MLYHSLGDSHQHEVDDDSRYQSCQGVDEIMCLDVNRCHAEEYIEWQHHVKHLAVARMPDEQHADGAYSHVRARESRRRALASRLGILHELVEYSIGVGRQSVWVLK